MLVADFDICAEWCARLFAGNPIYIFEFADGRAESVILADDYAITLGIDGQNIKRFARGKTQAFTLSDCELVQAIVAADDRAIFGDNFAFVLVERDATLARIRFDELHVATIGNETELHAFGLFRNGEIHAAGERANFFLGEFAERKVAAGKLLLGEPPEKIGLVLRIVARAKKLPAAGSIVSADAGIVTGGQTFGANLPRHAQERLELHIGVAIRTGDGRAPSKILIHEGANNAFFKLFLEIHDVVRKIEMLRDALRVVDIVERAAAMLRRAVALQFGEAALIPELHGEANNGPALLLHDGSDGGGIDAPGHGYSDEASGRGCRRGKRVELGCCRHCYLCEEGTMSRAPTGERL